MLENDVKHLINYFESKGGKKFSFKPGNDHTAKLKKLITNHFKVN